MTPETTQHRFTLQRLASEDASVMIVCACPPGHPVLDELKRHCDALYWKGTDGFDFSAYAICLNELAQRAPGSDVLMFNDSVLGPFCALAPFVEGGFDHAVWGADITLVPLNLCRETLDGIRNHSWSRPAPGTPEAEVVSWADRIAYVCHDFEDAVDAGIVTPEELPAMVKSRCGTTRSQQLGTFITSMVRAAMNSGRIGMEPDVAEALAAFRKFNYEQVYLRPESRHQADQVIALLRALVEFYTSQPIHLPEALRATSGSKEAQRFAVEYVAGMTDRFACRQGAVLLGWSTDQLPRGIDV